MELLLVLLTAYVIAGAAWPQIVRSRRLFLFGFAAVLLAMLLWTLPFGAFQFLARLGSVAAFALLVLAALGRSPGEFWRDLVAG